MTVENKMTVTFDVDGSEVKLSPAIVKEYITGGQELSNSEYKMFVELCKVRKLNPFLKEAYAIKFGSNPAQIVVGKDAILKRAIKHPQYNGREQGIIVINRNGEIEERKGTFRLNDEELVGGWARVYRKDHDHPTYISVSFDEVAQKKGNGQLNSNWANKGATMVEKVALVRALRETFVEDLGGMIDADEAWNNQELNRDNAQPEAKKQAEPEIPNTEEVIDVEFEETQLDFDAI